MGGLWLFSLRLGPRKLRAHVQHAVFWGFQRLRGRLYHITPVTRTIVYRSESVITLCNEKIHPNPLRLLFLLSHPSSYSDTQKSSWSLGSPLILNIKSQWFCVCSCYFICSAISPGQILFHLFGLW